MIYGRRKSGDSSPCEGCTERWVTEHGRCHSSCERYLIWADNKRKENNALKRANNPNGSRYFKTKLGETAKATKHRYR